MVVECLDPEGDEPVADGEPGELVATTLFNRVWPLVRYRSDDIVRVTRDACACGRTHARVWPIGRKGDEVVVDGRPVLPLDVWDAVESAPGAGLGLFQVVRPAREVDVLRLRVGYRPGEGDTAGAVRAAVLDGDRRRARGRAGDRGRAAAPRAAAQDPPGRRSHEHGRGPLGCRVATTGPTGR